MPGPCSEGLVLGRDGGGLQEPAVCGLSHIHMTKKLQAKANSGKGEILQRVMFGRAETYETKDFFLRKIQETVHGFESLWTAAERNGKGMSVSHNRNLTGGRDHQSRNDVGDKPVEMHRSSFHDELQMLQSEGTVSECSQVVTNINSSTSGLPPQRTRSVHKGNSHKQESAVMHPSELAPHQESHKKKSYKCNECDIMFLQDSELTRYQRIHTGRKPYKGDVCGKALNDNVSLAVHQRNHIGEKPYTCDVCGKAFTYKKSHALHQTLHAGEGNHINVMYVAVAILESQSLEFIREFILERILINVMYVVVALLERDILELIGEFILKRNLTNVIAVTNVFLRCHP
ncbi:zinc finger protein 347-like [Ovis aries]|uniref:zinc finger protein 347-like n=1 Tax=Ovis aries TaxID=9940 RepID=UPI001C2EEB72|nr:zinc finger protein 347-like isoform X1 [Ovis aries]XP_027833607.2 zinc finger protein 347-like isoform X1 [Ovis aries]XP_027833608.2 zinc finger protein 347-like isoform X1 [Ovis aries]XP_042087077.1 zinc finger protein 347-like isoform X1 [Ovis aries]XP_042087078.1 zinc finger protein 347-like isoform X1 [Ovis aries]XP_042087079.1 zinc finger protein 347-like isoform X1 [Ovis aries]XP_060254950.1 zinc finger protein 347-like [Ovis aries]